MQRPLTGVVLFFVLGILFGHYTAIDPVIWLVAGGIACVGSLVARRFAGCWLALLLLFTGAAGLTLHRSPVSPLDLRLTTSSEPELVVLRGEVLTVDLRERDSRTGDVTLRLMAVVRADSLQRRGQAPESVSGDVLATTRFGNEVVLVPGQQVWITGVLAAPDPAFARGMFDYRAHLGWRGIYRTLEFEGGRDLEIVTEAEPGLPERFQSWGRAVLQRGLPDNDETVPLLWAMVLGWKTSLTDEVAEPFMRSGTLHLFAISGLHIGLIAGIVVALLRLVRVPRGAVGLVAVPALWFFVAATGWQPSAVRATIMLSIVIGGWSLNRPVNLLNSLAAAGLLILMWDPRQLFHAGFQLSFAVVAAIGLMLPPLEQWRQRLLRTDPLLPAELRPRWQQQLDPPVRWLTTSFAVSLAAWLGSLPLIMHYFHLVTPLGLLANVVVVALGSAALAAALGSLLTAPFVPMLNELFNHSAWFFAGAMREVSVWFSELPSAWWHTRSPPLVCVAAYYVAVGVVVSGALVRRPRLALPAVLALLALAAFTWRDVHRVTRLTVLPLNGGHAVFYESGDGANWLIDCGDEGSYRYRVRPFLQARGINRIDHFVLSHGDVRHAGGATALIAEFRPREVHAGPQSHRSSSYRAVLDELAAHGREVGMLGDGAVVSSWEVLHPARGDRFSRADSGPLVMAVEIAGKRVILAPDLDAAGQTLLIERHPALRADVLITSAGTDHQPAGQRFLATLQPAGLVLVDAYYPAGDLAKPDLRERLYRQVAEVWFSSDAGVIELRDESDDLVVAPMNPGAR